MINHGEAATRAILRWSAIVALIPCPVALLAHTSAARRHTSGVTRVARACIAGAATAEAGMLWDKVVQTVSGATLAATGATSPGILPLRNFVRELDPRTLKVRSEQTQDVTAPAQAPYVSPPPDTIAKYGFAVSERDGTVYYAPDAHTLISTVFADNHCLRARAGDRVHPGLVGVTFEPVNGNRVGDIRGTLWIDSTTSALRYLEYFYTGEPSFVTDSLAGGRVDFAALPSGTWIVQHWVIRMPKFGRWSNNNNAMSAHIVGGVADSAVIAVIEIGGTALPAPGAAASVHK